MLIDMPSLLVFMSAALVLLVSPGPAVLFIIARSLEQGRLAGIVSVLGIALAALVHVLVAALGLSALLRQSALAFSLIKYLGAAYLVYLGIRTLRNQAEIHPIEYLKPQALSRVFWQGFTVNLLNPKTTLFFLAFLPQFVNPNRGSVTLQIIFLGMVFVTMAVISDGMYAGVAGSIRHWLVGNLRVAKLQKNFAGGVYIALGIGLALSGHNSK